MESEHIYQQRVNKTAISPTKNAPQHFNILQYDTLAENLLYQTRPNIASSYCSKRSTLLRTVGSSTNRDTPAEHQNQPFFLIISQPRFEDSIMRFLVTYKNLQ